MPHRSKAKRKHRVGLVLGAGGPVVHAFHAGVLHALHDELCWDPREADVVLGTSAGAQVGELLRAGMSGAALAARPIHHQGNRTRLFTEAVQQLAALPVFRLSNQPRRAKRPSDRLRHGHPPGIGIA